MTINNTEVDLVEVDTRLMKRFRSKFERTKRIIVKLAEKTRQDGHLALECKIAKLQDGYKLLADGIQLVVDGTDTEDIDRFFDNVAKFADNWVEDAYVSLVKQGVHQIANSNNPKFIKWMLDKGFDFDRQILSL